jgi:hypothetical protein
MGDLNNGNTISARCPRLIALRFVSVNFATAASDTFPYDPLRSLHGRGLG